MSATNPGLRDRLAGAPISWGVCEVPAWGYALSASRVLDEMAGLGLKGTELGAAGFLPADSEALRRVLDEHGLSLVGGFVFLVLHEAACAADALAAAKTASRRIAAAGGEVLISAAYSGVPDLSGRPHVDGGGWLHMLAMLEEVDMIAERHGLRHVFHPHAGTVVESSDEVRRVLDGSDVALCLDTGHLAIGGADSLALARDAAGRIGHVHLKDVNPAMAEGVRNGAIGFQAAVRKGLFRPLGQGSVPVARIVSALEDRGYRGWYVLEQDAALTAEPADLMRPMADTRTSIAYLSEATRQSITP
jgi:inosose dehydratase